MDLLRKIKRVGMSIFDLSVDLIKWVSSQRAIGNINPNASNIEVGDYGTLDSASGQFIVQGNVFRESIVPANHSPLALSGSWDDHVQIHTLENLQLSTDLPLFENLNASDVVYMAKCTANIDDPSKKDRKLLVSYKSRGVTLSPDFDVQAIEKHPTLSGKRLITAVMKCKAYLRCLCSAENGNLSFALYRKPSGILSWMVAMSGQCEWGESGEDKEYTVLFESQECEGKAE